MKERPHAAVRCRAARCRRATPEPREELSDGVRLPAVSTVTPVGHLNVCLQQVKEGRHVAVGLVIKVPFHNEDGLRGT